MTLPSEIIILILSYFSYTDLQHLKIPYDYYKGYIENYIGNRPSKWLHGMHNNLRKRCFSCENLFHDSNLTILCTRCKLSLNDCYTYPRVCFNCITIKHMVRGKALSYSCSLCNDNRIHMIIVNRTNLLRNTSVVNSRRCGKTSSTYPFTINDIENMIDDIKIINFHNHTFQLLNLRQTREDKMDWCVEKASLQKDNASKEIQVRYTCDPKPLYILIIFNSTINEDFTGGEHVYSDGHTINPLKGDFVFFDAQEPYMVNPILSGTRFCTKIIFY